MGNISKYAENRKQIEELIGGLPLPCLFAKNNYSLDKCPHQPCPAVAAPKMAATTIRKTQWDDEMKNQGTAACR